MENPTVDGCEQKKILVNMVLPTKNPISSIPLRHSAQRQNESGGHHISEPGTMGQEPCEK